MQKNKNKNLWLCLCSLFFQKYLLIKKTFLRPSACAFKFPSFRSTRCLRFSYATPGNWQHPQRIIASCCVRVSMATNGGAPSVWRRGGGVGGVQSGRTAILQTSTTLCVTSPLFCCNPVESFDCARFHVFFDRFAGTESEWAGKLHAKDLLCIVGSR